jgi:hypothetical protein
LIKLIHGLFITTLLLISTSAYSEDMIIVDIVLPAKNSTLEKLSKKIAEEQNFIVHTYENQLPNNEDKGDILIIVSENLLPLLKSNSYKAKFALYVNSNEYFKSQHKNATALFSDQPLKRQVLLIKSIFDNKKVQLGIAYQDKTYEKIIDDISIQNPLLTINSYEINTPNIIRSVTKIIQNNDVLLTTSENTIYNSDTIRPILLSSYRHQTLVIGPTEGFVKAGALATVLSTPDQYTSDIVSMVNYYIDTKKLPAPQYPSNFAVKINYSVAESLGLTLPSEEELRRRFPDGESN